MHTFCLQSAYQVSVTELFQSSSVLKDRTIMEKEEYVRIWKLLAESRKLPRSEIRTARSKQPLWELLEGIVNKELKKVSIEGRKGRIQIALDDDKIWFASFVATVEDLFNLKFTTHVKPNRKGFVAHTATTTGIITPLCIVFERAKDSTSSCFKRILDFLFAANGKTNLNNVSVHSDRGYILPVIVFQYLLLCGAHLVCTIKRLAQCWPFTYKQSLREGDKRTLIDVKGSATLYVKSCETVSSMPLYAAAFRNGSQNVAMGITTEHAGHQREGTAHNPQDYLNCLKDPESLQKKFLQRVDLGQSIDDNESEEDPRDNEAEDEGGNNNNNDIEEQEHRALIQLMLSKVKPLTLFQGMLANIFI